MTTETTSKDIPVMSTAIDFVMQAQSGGPSSRDESRAVMEAAKVQQDQAIASARRKLIGIAMGRIEGKEFAARRPPTSMHLVFDGGIAAKFEPQVVNSSQGWTVNGLTMRLDVARRVLILDVREDGSLRGTRWTVDVAPALLAVARHLLRAFDQGMAHVMAVANSSGCWVCGRALTDEHSRARGIGPECIRLLFTRHVVPADIETPEALAEKVLEIRRAIRAEHPDMGGSGDGLVMRELMASLEHLKRRIEQLKPFHS